ARGRADEMDAGQTIREREGILPDPRRPVGRRGRCVARRQRQPSHKRRKDQTTDGDGHGLLPKRSKVTSLSPERLPALWHEHILLTVINAIGALRNESASRRGPP